MNVLSADVGTGSVRVALTRFEDGKQGKILASATHDTKTSSPHREWYQQKSTDIWSGVINCAKKCLLEAKTTEVSGIAFTATCSLVVLNEGSEEDVIMWMDHRAVKEAQKITASEDEKLNQAGGVCSPEFSLAKLSWLKQNHPDQYSSAYAFLELPDFLTWKCLESKEYPLEKFGQSNCSVTCKWFYDAPNDSWPASFYEKIGLKDLTTDTKRVGSKPRLPGSRVGFMTEEVKKEMGIDTKCQVAVATSIIDAHSGVLAMITLFANERIRQNLKVDVEQIFCSIVGTSSCHMVSSRDRKERKGIWGPYYNVILNDYYVLEPGQSATGKLLDHVIRTHPEYPTTYKDMNMHEIYVKLNQQLKQRNNNVRNGLVVNPDYHGNRCPLADSTLKGGVYGLDLSEPKLVDMYEATLQALVYETKFIIDQIGLEDMDAVLVSGGLTKNDAFMQIYADVLGVQVTGLELGKVDMMLAGTAVMARQAVFNKNLNLEDLEGVSFDDLNLVIFKPQMADQKYHEGKYKAYRKFMSASQEMQQILSEAMRE